MSDGYSFSEKEPLFLFSVCDGDAEEVLLGKDSSLYLPNDLPDELGRQRCLKGIVYNPV